MSSLPIPGAVIYAKNLSKLSHFYEQIMQFGISHADDTYSILALSHFQLVIHAIPAHIADTFDIKTPPERREDTAIKLVLPVSDIGLARETAARLGGQIDASEHEWEFQQCRICDGYDPEGNVFQIRAFLPRHGK
ncbi:hypothetical protein [Undibacterium sp. Ji49W]|uniref:hypothetical protein n=1 Tax=Undibacterium sp. Ji49W TaxID=3413040 RepID=UPI003BF01E79